MMKYIPPHLELDVSPLVRIIQPAQRILLTTHRHCDGDGLGAIMALQQALNVAGHHCRTMTVDAIPQKYKFLPGIQHIEAFEGPHAPIEPPDLVMIFDTNDRRLVDPFYTHLEGIAKEIIFVDHHPVLAEGPLPTTNSFINTDAASTGEIAFFIIKALGINLDAVMSRCLYTSIAFDTQIFRYVKNSPTSHLIAAELIEIESAPQVIHRSLFANHTKEKLHFLGKVLSEVEFYHNDQVATLKVALKDLADHQLSMDDARDVIDMIMNIQSVQIAALFREDAPGEYKLSMRSKGLIPVLPIAESLGGGGHRYAAGALIHGTYAALQMRVLDAVSRELTNIESGPAHGTRQKKISKA